MSDVTQEWENTLSLSAPKWESLIPVVLVILCVLAWLPRIEGPLDFRWDGGTYYVLGTALAQGKGYRLLNEPGEIEATQYPPLLPALVAAHQLVLGTSDPVIVGKLLRLSFFAIFTGYILAAYYFFKQRLQIRWAVVGTLICLLNLFTTFLSDLCFAEIPFGLTSLLFFYFASKNRTRYDSALAGFFAIMTYLLRTAGLALFVAWVVESLVRREFKKAAARILVCLIPIIGWQAYIISVETSDAYFHPAYEYQRADYLFYNTSYARNVSLRDPMSPEKGKATTPELVQRFFGNLIQMPLSLGEGISAKTYNWDHWLQATAGLPSPSGVTTICLDTLGFLVLTGVGVQLMRRQVVIPIFILAYVAAVCLTPWPFQWTRYWTPLAPVLVLSLSATLLAVRDYLGIMFHGRGKSVANSIGIAILAMILAIEVPTLFNFYNEHHQDVERVGELGQKVHYRLFYYDGAYRELDRALDWIRGHSRAGDVLAASMPHWAYLQTGLKTVMPPFERDLGKAQSLLDSVPVRFVIVDKSVVDFARQYMLPLLRSQTEGWALAYSEGNDESVQVYRRILTTEHEAAATVPSERSGR